jgi:hypothetical protein
MEGVPVLLVAAIVAVAIVAVVAWLRRDRSP